VGRSFTLVLRPRPVDVLGRAPKNIPYRGRSRQTSATFGLPSFIIYNIDGRWHIEIAEPEYQPCI
jgi:hypothetical protein